MCVWLGRRASRCFRAHLGELAFNVRFTNQNGFPGFKVNCTKMRKHARRLDQNVISTCFATPENVYGIRKYAQRLNQNASSPCLPTTENVYGIWKYARRLSQIAISNFVART